jgi:hypothetical protein
MRDLQSLDRAYSLREEGNFREAYSLFMLAANRTKNLLERAGILLNAATNLTQPDEQERSRNQLKQIRELLGGVGRYAGTASTMESEAAVGMTRANRQPAPASNSRNCFSVRSHPLGKISIWRSRNLPGENSLPG